MKSRNGFTIVEVMTVTVVIAILATFVTVSLNRQQIQARDAERSTKATLIASALEKYYDGHGEYPSARAILNTYGGNTGTAVAAVLAITDKDILVTPTATAGTTNSIAASLGATDVFAYVAQSTVGNDNCQTNLTGGCDEFTLSYKKEVDGSTVTIESTYKGRAGDYQSPLEAPAKPTLAVVQSGANLVATSSVPTCSTNPAMTPRYSFREQIGAGAWSAWGSWQAGTTYTRGSNTNATSYTFQVQVRCETGTTVSDTSPASDTQTITYYIIPAAPAVPTITATLSTTYAQGASGTVACNYGTAQYRREWRTNDGTWQVGAWDTILIANITAAQGSKYGFRTTARCVNGTQTTQGATSGEATYIHPIAIPAGPTVPGPAGGAGQWATAANRTSSWSSSGCPSGTWAIYQYNFLRWNGSWAWMSGTWTGTGTGASAYNSADDWGVYYNIGVMQACQSNYTTSGWSAATWGANYYTNYVGYSQLRGWSMRIMADNSVTLALANYGADCDAYTTRQIFIETSWDNAAFVLMGGVGWYDYPSAPPSGLAIAHTTTSGHSAEFWPRTRCINPNTGAATSASGLTSISRLYNIGNLYNKGSSKYNISCGWGSANNSLCSGGYNSSGTNASGTSYDACAIRAGGIEDTANRYTPYISLSATPPCWLISA